MRQRLLVIFHLVIISISLLGILDAGFITWNSIRGVIPPCRPPFACSEVLKSSWAHVGPFPLSLLGLLYYSTIFVLGIRSYCDKFFILCSKKILFRTKDILFLLTVGGVFFSLYLVFIMAFVLHAWCLYCLFSAAFSLLLCVFTFLILQVGEDSLHSFVPSMKRVVFGLLYRHVAKPFFFRFNADRVHAQMKTVGVLLGGTIVTRIITEWVLGFKHPTLNKKINGIVFPNLVGLSAGFDYNADLTSIISQVGFGFATVGTVTNEPYEGNAKPQLGRYPLSKALLVNKGFKSLGAKAIIKKLKNRHFNIPIGISIGSTNKNYSSLSAQIDDIIQSFYLFEHSNALHSYYELNISCPNTTGGQPFTTSERLESLLSHLDRLNTVRPVYIKMPIDLPDTETLSLLRTANIHNIAGVVFGNLTKDKENPDVHPLDRAHWKTVAGNVSGKPTMNRSNHCIQLTKKKYKSRFTIIGTGGIFSPQDAELKFKLGADLVQLITGMIYEGPQLVGEINEYLAHQRT